MNNRFTVKLAWWFGIFCLILQAHPTWAITPVKERVAVLITDWGMPQGYNFEYAWNSHKYCRVGDRTHYPGEPCKIGHVGPMPAQVHIGILPVGITWPYPGNYKSFDNSGIYKLVNGVYVSIHPDALSVLPSQIPAGVPIVPAVEIQDPMTGKLMYPPDPRTGEDHLAGWYKIGDSTDPSRYFQNGLGDTYEGAPLSFMRWYAMMGAPTEPPEAYQPYPYVEDKLNRTRELLEESFGDRVDVRVGVYDQVTGYTEHEQDVAEDFVRVGYRKMLIARETTDNNHYANNFMSGNYVKERLCELGVLDEMEIYQTRQVGRTPEFNSMNILNLKKIIESYPPGSTIGIVYVTRGLPWNSSERSETDLPFFMGTSQPFSKEVYFENSFLNYLSWKKALQKAYGDKYNLVFTKGGVESDLLQDNLFTYGVNTKEQNAGYFMSICEAIQQLKADGVDKIIIAPCHWLFDAHDVLIIMRENNNLPIPPVENIRAGLFEYTHCEDLEGNEVTCGTAGSVAEITVASSFSHLTEEFATSYYVVLRGTLERFGLFPYETDIRVEVSQPVTKLLGGTVEVTDPDSPVYRAKIVIPGDPYPDWPDNFTPATRIPPNDPEDTFDCLWEDTVINIGQQINPPFMKSAQLVGPAVHFGPYRTFFNRDVLITIPFDYFPPEGKELLVYIYNHLTKDWDAIQPVNIDQNNKTVTFKTQVLGLFQAGYPLEPQLVQITSFSAVSKFKKVILKWTTASEVDNAGFNIYRSEDFNGEFVKINEALIPAKGSSTRGASYFFIDEDITKENTYCYKLEDVDLSGKATLHGPVCITPGSGKS